VLRPRLTGSALA
jgi:hypothetical protein